MIPFSTYYQNEIGFGATRKEKKAAFIAARRLGGPLPPESTESALPKISGSGTMLVPRKDKPTQRIPPGFILPPGPRDRIGTSTLQPGPGTVNCTTDAGVGACIQCCRRFYQGKAKKQCVIGCQGGGTQPPPPTPPPGTNCFELICKSASILPCTCPTGWTQKGSQCCASPGTPTPPPTPPPGPPGPPVPGSGECRLNCGAGTGGVQCVYICDDYRSLPGTVSSGGTPAPVPYADYSGSYTGAEVPVIEEEGELTTSIKEHWPWIAGGLVAIYLLTRKQRQAAA